MTKPGDRGRKTPVENITNDRYVLLFREDCVLIVTLGPPSKKEIIKKAPSYCLNNSNNCTLGPTEPLSKCEKVFFGFENAALSIHAVLYCVEKPGFY